MQLHFIQRIESGIPQFNCQASVSGVSEPVDPAPDYNSGAAARAHTSPSTPVWDRTRAVSNRWETRSP
jgi:hypothetical protein